jgi:hypothetical protein
VGGYIGTACRLFMAASDIASLSYYLGVVVPTWACATNLLIVEMMGAPFNPTTPRRVAKGHVANGGRSRPLAESKHRSFVLCRKMRQRENFSFFGASKLRFTCLHFLWLYPLTAATGAQRLPLRVYLDIGQLSQPRR